MDPDGAGDVTECYFEFGTTTSYGSAQSCAESLPITGPQTVHAVLPGTSNETTYHYRLVVSRGSSETVARGADKTITPHYVDFLRTGPATNITRSSAKLEAAFNGTGLDTHYYFEYGPTASYGSKEPASAPPGNDAGVTSGNTPIAVERQRAQRGDDLPLPRRREQHPTAISAGVDRTFTTTEAIKELKTNAGDRNHARILRSSTAKSIPTGSKPPTTSSTARPPHTARNSRCRPGNPLGTTSPGLAPVPGSN